MRNELLATVSVVGATMAGALGGFDSLLQCMLTMMLLDVAMGIIAAAVFNTSKYSKNGLTSDGMMRGIFRKISILIIVVVGVTIDKALEICYIRNAIVLYFIATEGLSILEHLVHIGVPFPKFISNILNSVLEQADKGGNEND